jgi:hypothetical protein
VLAAPATAPPGCGPTFFSSSILRVDNGELEQKNVFRFGRTPIGESTTHTVRVTNTGTVGATIASPLPGGAVPAMLPAAAPFFHTGGSCREGLTVQAGESCTLDIRFAPTEVSHTDQQPYVGFVEDGNSGIARFRLVGTGAYTGAVLRISDAPGYDFGTQPVGSVTHKGFLVWSEGTEALVFDHIDERTLGLTPPFSLVSTSCQSGATMTPVRELALEDIASAFESSLPPAVTAGCVVVLAFSPLEPGPVSGALQVSYRPAAGGDALVVRRPVAGAGSLAAP